MFFCSYVFKKNMFSCITDACVVRFGDRTSYASLNNWISSVFNFFNVATPLQFPKYLYLCIELINR